MRLTDVDSSANYRIADGLIQLTKIVGNRQCNGSDGVSTRDPLLNKSMAILMKTLTITTVNL